MTLKCMDASTDRQVWHRCRAGVRGEWPARLVNRPVGENSMVDGLRWFLAYAGLPALLALAIPAVLPAVRPGGGHALSSSGPGWREWRWGPG